MTETNPNLQDLIDILALPNMGDEGRKAKLLAIKDWQIRFLEKIQKQIKEADEQADLDTNYKKCLRCNKTITCISKGCAVGKSQVLREEILGETYSP